ncbi:hypothetical protein NDN08_005531 [Rhodosorus marinus]|uniref:C2H2-type domain-containing protein n=1 Tax=Rhodosorus marinus TaxID=101924 RepID=A0AAV8V4L9_9RHOD|nr:hypothetical protein NDN08_005531 [Rhodosorus marinus]
MVWWGKVGGKKEAPEAVKEGTDVMVNVQVVEPSLPAEGESSLVGEEVEKDNGASVHNCDKCPKKFERLSNLKAHRRMHTGETPYKCDVPDCAKSFKWKSSLSSHMKSHGKTTGVKETEKSPKPGSKATSMAPKPLGQTITAKLPVPGLVRIASLTPESGKQGSIEQRNGVQTANTPIFIQQPENAFPPLQRLMSADTPIQPGPSPRTVLTPRAVQPAPARKEDDKSGNKATASANPVTPSVPLIPLAYQSVLQVPGMTWVAAPWASPVPSSPVENSKLVYGGQRQPVQLSPAGTIAPTKPEGGTLDIQPAPLKRLSPTGATKPLVLKKGAPEAETISRPKKSKRAKVDSKANGGPKAKSLAKAKHTIESKKPSSRAGSESKQKGDPKSKITDTSANSGKSHQRKTASSKQASRKGRASSR